MLAAPLAATPGDGAGAALGASLHADIFSIANTVPNMLYILLAGGVFNAVLVPQLSLSMEEAKVSRWLVQDGEAVAAGQLLVEVETDKATVEIEAPGSGVLRIVAAGNVAGEGAKMALLSVRERAGARALLEEVTYVELSDRPDFNDKFVEQLAF